METENCVTEKMRNIQNMTILMVQVMEEKMQPQSHILKSLRHTVSYRTFFSPITTLKFSH